MQQLEGRAMYRAQIERDLAAAGGASEQGAASAVSGVCAACGTANDADARFCKGCGTALGGKA
jgi:hypothetical protein